MFRNLLLIGMAMISGPAASASETELQVTNWFKVSTRYYNVTLNTDKSKDRFYCVLFDADGNALVSGRKSKKSRYQTISIRYKGDDVATVKCWS